MVTDCCVVTDYFNGNQSLKSQQVNKNRACCSFSFVGKACYNLLKQLVADLWIKSFDNRLQRVFRELATDLSQAMRTHQDCCNNLLQDVDKLLADYVFWMFSVSNKTL